MSTAVQQLLEAFQVLTLEERTEAAAVIIRSVAGLVSPPLDDEALAQIADQSFQEYDAREAGRDS